MAKDDIDGQGHHLFYFLKRRHGWILFVYLKLVLWLLYFDGLSCGMDREELLLLCASLLTTLGGFSVLDKGEPREMRGRGWRCSIIVVVVFALLQIY